MTNAEKFIKTFNMNPDNSQCPCFCSSCQNYWDTDRYDKCLSGDWWQMEYQEPKAKVRQTIGMSIEEAINGVEKRILPIYDNDADHKALVMAIDTMRKYQKIEQIISDGYLQDKTSGEMLLEIKEVINHVDQA